MTNGTRAQEQQSFEEQPLDNARLAQVLNDWQSAKDRLRGPRKSFNAINATAKELIEQAELPNGLYRVGKFVVNIKPVEEREISFERTASKRVTIKLAKT